MTSRDLTPAELALLHAGQQQLEYKRAADREHRRRLAGDQRPLFEAALPILPAPAPVVSESAAPARGVADVVRVARSTTTSTAPAPAPRLSTEAVTATLTACLESAECPKTARAIFQLLHRLGLETVRARGLLESASVAVFHLPAELVPAHLGIADSTLYNNLKPLREAGIIAHCAHYGNLRGQTAATGTIWAVSLMPGRVLAGLASPVRLTFEDKTFKWRDLNRDAWAKRTAHALLNNPIGGNGESFTTLEVEERFRTLQAWALHPFQLQTPGVTLTLQSGTLRGLEAVYALSDAASASRQERGEIVDARARALAFALADQTNLNFWRWLLWQLTRAADQGLSLFDDVQAVLVRVFHMGREGTAHKPGAFVIHCLKESGVWDVLRSLPLSRVGVKPIAA